MGGVRDLIAVPRPDPASAVHACSRPKASITAGSSLFEASICLDANVVTGILGCLMRALRTG